MEVINTLYDEIDRPKTDIKIWKKKTTTEKQVLQKKQTHIKKQTF